MCFPLGSISPYWMLRPRAGCRPPETVRNVRVGTLERFCWWNTVEISENSENHLKAIVGWRQAAGKVGVTQVPKCRHEKSRGEGKAPKIGSRDGRSSVSSANYVDFRGVGGPPPDWPRGTAD